MSFRAVKTSPGLGSKAGYSSNDVQCKCSTCSAVHATCVTLAANSNMFAVHKDCGVTKERAC